MKRCMVLMILLSVWATGHAQYRALGAAGSTAAVSPLVQKKTMRIAYEATKPPGLRMRGAGTIMTLCGGGLIIAGAIIAANADPNAGQTYVNSNGTTYTDGDVDQAMGVLGIVAGVGLTVPGVILWTKGNKKYKRYLETQTAFNFTKNGVGLTYRF
jgi:hypothetical protein